MGFISGDRDQTTILGYCLSDFVEEKSKPRFIVKIVEKLDTRELYSRYSSQGGEAIDPKLQLATWFLGYCEGVTSSRKLENNCKKHLDYIYISANVQPDHTSLSRFRKRHMDLIPKYFVEIVREAYKQKISDFKEISVDGTKVQSVSSRKKSMRTNKLEEKIKRVKEDVTKYFEEAEKEDEKIEKLQKKIEKLEKAKELLDKRKAEMQGERQENHQINIEEPEAMMQSLGSSKGSFPGYNAQISTDTKTHLIVSGEVVEDRNDKKQFLPQHKNTEEVIGEDKERKYVADGGYNSHDTIEEIEKKEIDAYIGNRREVRSTEEKISKKMKLGKDDFKYEDGKDEYICPAGKVLNYWSTGRKKGRVIRKYRCRECAGCELSKQCLGKENKKRERVISREEREELINRMQQKIDMDVGQEMMFKRKTTVEAVIGNIKSNMGHSRFRLKGLAAVNGEFMMMCIGHNLNKLYKLLVFCYFLPIFGPLNFLYTLIDTKNREAREYQIKFVHV